MISAVTNIANTFSGTINVAAGSVAGKLPDVNSTALLNVIEKLDKSYRVLINGKVFQAQLPINAEKGDDILAKVLQQNPFTLSLDKFGNLLAQDSTAIYSLLEKLSLVKNALSEKVLRNVIAAKKSLTKTKLEKLINYMEKAAVDFDETQIVILINLIWDNPNESFNDVTKSYNKIFDISFEKLCEEIFESLLILNSLNLPQNIYNKINDVMIFEFNNEADKLSLISLGDKSDEFLSLTRLIESEIAKDYLSAASISSLEVFQSLLIKYILQKAIYNKYSIYPEFTVVKSNDNLDLLNYQFQKTTDEKDESIKLFINTEKYANKGTAVQAVMSGAKLFGVVNSSTANFSKIENYLCKLNSKIFEEINISSYLTVTVDETKEIITDSFSNLKRLNKLA